VCCHLRAKMTHKKRKTYRNVPVLLFNVLEILYWGLEAFPVAWTEDRDKYIAIFDQK
jgi:hypothetical protein